MTETVQLPITELIEDWDIYPRTQVSSVNVNNIVLALQAGHVMPPIIADRETKKIVDGWHRRTAYRKVLGPDAVVDVELRDYASKANLLAAATELNIGRGLDLQEYEKRKVATRLEALGVSINQIALTLHVPEKRVIPMLVQVGTVVNDDGTPIRSEPLKLSVIHLQGKEMTERQAAAHRSAPGTSWLQVIAQLRKGVTGNIINAADDRVITALKGLVEDLNDYLSTVR